MNKIVTFVEEFPEFSIRGSTGNNVVTIMHIESCAVLGVSLKDIDKFIAALQSIKNALEKE